MKKLGFYNYYTEYNNNNMFNPDFSSPIGDDLSYPARYIASEAEKKGISVSTIDTEPLSTYDAIIFLDFPTLKNPFFKKLLQMKFENIYLIINENELIRPDNWNEENFKYFKKVFCWNEQFVDNIKTFKFFLPNRIPPSIPMDIHHKTGFCCLIAGNKSSNHPLELYSERIHAIRWFEKNEPESFDLFGHQWDEHVFKGLFRPLNLSKPLRHLFSSCYPSYQGTVISKHGILKQYKFSICYENARDIPGYITEKIFDSFFAGCIPVYLGAPNITEYIPEDTFIDKRKFETYSDLFNYMNNLSENEHAKYIESINNFVQSERIFPFSVENYSDIILKLVSNE